MVQQNQQLKRQSQLILSRVEGKIDLVSYTCVKNNCNMAILLLFGHI